MSNQKPDGIFPRWSQGFTPPCILGQMITVQVPTYRKWYQFWKPEIVGFKEAHFVCISSSDKTIDLKDYSIVNPDNWKFYGLNQEFVRI